MVKVMLNVYNRYIKFPVWVFSPAEICKQMMLRCLVLLAHAPQDAPSIPRHYRILTHRSIDPPGILETIAQPLQPTYLLRSLGCRSTPPLLFFSSSLHNPTRGNLSHKHHNAADRRPQVYLPQNLAPFAQILLRLVMITPGL